MGDQNGETKPLQERMEELCARTGYTYEVSSGQRKYGGPPPEWSEDQGMPPTGSEIYCGRIPPKVEEDQLIPLFEQCGTIYDLRMMMDPGTGLHRGFCFCLFTDPAAAKEAVKQLDGYEVKPGKSLKVNVSIPNVRLYVGNLPKNRDRDELYEAISKVTDGLKDVIVYTTADDPKKKNRGFAFLDYDTHKSASNARKRFLNGRARIFNCDIYADWADAQEEPDEETMAKVKVLYVRGLKADITEEMLKELFSQYGEIEKVKKIKDYGFIHFNERDNALAAMEALNGTELNTSEMSISLAKPVDNKQKDHRKAQHAGGGGAGHLYPPPRADTGKRGAMRGGRGMMGGARGMRGMMMMGMGMRGMKPRPLVGGGGAFRGLTAMADYYEEDYYDDGSGYYDNSYYGDDSYYEDDSYDDYSSLGGTSFGKGFGLTGAPRGRGGMRGARGGGIPSLVAAAMRGGGGGSGLRGAPRGRGMGIRGAPRGRAGPRGVGARGGRGGRGAGGRGAKRDASGDGMGGFAKKQKMDTSDGGWNTGPIAQQPLAVDGGGQGWDASGGDAQWYQDSFDQGQQWG